MTTTDDTRLRALLDHRWRAGGPTVRELILRREQEAYDKRESMRMTMKRPLLRAPGEPRHDDPKIPGFGICDHPEHGTAVWLIEGEILEGKAIGRCVRHSNAIERLAEDVAAAYPISLEAARRRVLGEVGLS